jgi:hypothetical protein
MRGGKARVSPAGSAPAMRRFAALAALAARASSSSTSWRFQRLRVGRPSQLNVRSVTASGTRKSAAPSSSTHESFVRFASSNTASSSAAAPSQIAARYRRVRVQILAMGSSGW